MSSSRSMRSSISPFRSRRSPAGQAAATGPPARTSSGGRPSTPSSSSARPTTPSSSSGGRPTTPSAAFTRPTTPSSACPTTPSSVSSRAAGRAPSAAAVDTVNAKENIMVTVRFRPLSPREINKGDEVAWYADGDNMVRNEYNPSIAYVFGKRNAEDGIEKAVSAKKQKTAPEKVVPVKNDANKVKKQAPPKKVESSSSEEDSSYSEEEVPGFQPGKIVPENILINYVGPRHVQDATIEAILRHTLPQALSSVGDLVVLDIFAESITSDDPKGEKIPSAESTGFHLDTEENNNLVPGFLSALIGIRPGETRSLPIQFPESFEQESLRGVRAQFTIIAGDPESVSETCMSNVYRYGMVLWEMVTGEEAYSTYSPVQAAVGIAACGLRPEIPRDCPHFLRSLMTRCWDNCPQKRPRFSEIISILLRQNIR